MAKLNVYFETVPKDLPAVEYISRQDLWQRELLQKLASELEAKRTIGHPDARLLEDGRWSLWVRPPEGDAINHICYLSSQEVLSPVAQMLLAPESAAESAAPKGSIATKTLVIRSHLGERESIGGFHPGYWTVDDYISRLDSVARPLFLTAIDAIRNGSPSPYYTGDGTEFSIHIDRPDVGYGVHIKEVAFYKN